MDNLEMVNQDSTNDESSKELDRTVLVVHPIHQLLDVNSIEDYNPSATNSFDVPPSTKDEIMATGYPSNENIFVGHGFVGSFCPECGVANWVFECLTLNHINAIHNYEKDYPKGVFYEDKKIDFKRIVTLMDYQDSGYERGHLAAAGNHRYNCLAYYNTFWYGNTAPMGKGVNLILSNIEKQGRKLAREYKKLYSVTGSVFYSKREIKFMKDGSQVRVPDAYFKVFIYEAMRRTYEIYIVCGYMIDNESDDSENIKKISKDIGNGRRRLSSINEETGLKILSVTNGRRVYEVPLPNECRYRGIGS